ncbi:uncharacterized protein ACBR49_016656 [Aulostomus maculatus]
MKLTVLCLCLLNVAFVTSRLFARNDLQFGRSNLSKTHQRTALGQGRQRTLFARRGQYEQQRIYKPKSVPVPPKIVPPTKAAPKPSIPMCSQPGQSCFPQSGCCEPCSTCHCHFFNAICFCRRTNSQCTNKT